MAVYISQIFADGVFANNFISAIYNLKGRKVMTRIL